MQDNFDVFVCTCAYDGDAKGGIYLCEVPCCVDILYVSHGEDRQIAGRNVKCLCMHFCRVQDVTQITEERNQKRLGGHGRPYAVRQLGEIKLHLQHSQSVPV